MSEISSTHKIQNMNEKITNQLQTVLKHCKKTGCRPEPNSEFDTILSNIRHIIYMRNRKGIKTPENINLLFEQIQKYPTAARRNRRSAIVEFELAFQKKYDSIQKLTPHNLQILKFMCGDSQNGNKIFQQFINTDMDPIVTKAFLEQFYDVYYNNYIFVILPRARNIIELFTGTYKNDDFNEIRHQIEDYRTKSTLTKSEHVQMIIKYKNNQPLSMKEIGYIFYLTSARIQQILETSRNRFYLRFKNFDSLLKSYISDDANCVMAQLPEKTADMYKYQKDMKLQDIPTSTLNKVGKGLLSFFHIGKSKE